MGNGVRFEALGRAHVLRLDVNAMVRIEQILDCPFVDVAKRVSKGNGKSLRVSDFRAIICAGLGGNILLEDAGRIMDELGLKATFDLVDKAFLDAFPATGKEDQDQGNASRPVE